MGGGGEIYNVYENQPPVTVIWPQFKGLKAHHELLILKYNESAEIKFLFWIYTRP
jgi:hypothetical protein